MYGTFNYPQQMLLAQTLQHQQVPPPPPPLPPQNLMPPPPPLQQQQYQSHAGYQPIYPTQPTPQHAGYTPLVPPMPSNSASKHTKPHSEHKQATHKPQHSSQPKPPEKPPVVPPHYTKQAESRLRRETPFQANIKFKNDLPEIPSDPKMLTTNVNLQKLSQFTFTTIEKEPRRDLPLSADLGITISLLEAERFQVPDGPVALDPADEALVSKGIAARPTASTAVKNPLAERRAKAKLPADLSWTMRTTYISNDAEAPRKPVMDDKRAKVLASAAQDEYPSREQQIAVIEASFDAAKAAPKHPTNPSLQPVEVLPVLPDVDEWGVTYLLTYFDGDPTEEVEAMRKVPQELRKAVTTRCLMRGFKGQQEGSQTMMGLLLPAQPDSGGPSSAAQDGSQGVEPEQLAGEYVWAKEYSCVVQDAVGPNNEEGVYFLTFKKSAVTFCEVTKQLNLKRKDTRRSKKRARADDDEDGVEQEEEETEYARPSKVVVSLSELPENEVLKREVKRQRLLGTDYLE